MKNLSQHIIESFQENYIFEGVAEKDWMRMADLYLNDKDGAGVAKSIKDKNKAIARYVTGIKIAGESAIPDHFYSGGKMYDSSTFSAFYNKALELGATKDEIADEFSKLGEIPTKVSEQISVFAAKNFGSWVSGDLSKAVHKAGFDMTLSKGGNATTPSGKDAMSRNGCKWTIGYIGTVKTPKGEITIKFDAITDEGVNNNTIRFVFDQVSPQPKTSINAGYHIYSKTDFIKLVLQILAEE